MKSILFAAATIYRLYKKQNRGIPHFRMLGTLVFLFMLHLFHIALIFNMPSHWFFPWSSESKKLIQWLNGGVYVGFFLIIARLIFSPEKIDSTEVSEKSIRRAKIVLPIYFVLAILILGGLLIKRGIEMGRIHY
jgi:hypothetical protein